MIKNKHYAVDGVIGKKCSTCHKWCPLDRFGVRRSNWDGLNWECRGCIHERARQKKEGTWKPKPSRKKERRIIPCACGCGQLIETPGRWGERQYVIGHWGRVHKKGKYSPHLKKANERKKIRHSVRDGIKGKVCSACKEWYPLDRFYNLQSAQDGLSYRCKNCQKVRALEYYRAHRASIQAKRKTGHFRKRFNAYCRKYAKRRRRTDPEYRIKRNLRGALNAALKGAPKSAPTMELIGCTSQELRQHLESQFQEGMSWDNYGQPGWEIDHVIPCAAFDLTDPEQQKACFHYTNLQPLWGPDNLAKSDKVKGE